METTILRSTTIDRLGRVATLIVTCVLAQSCALLSPSHPGGQTAHGLWPPQTHQGGGGIIERGEASWYGPGFRGKKTALGEPFDERQLVAAHRTLPLGSRARVTNLTNGKSVEVEITDRGPFVRGRIIDLSKAAAQALGMIGPGTVPVEIELLSEQRLAPATLRR